MRQAVLDFAADSSENVQETRETRLYALTGTAATLDCLETLLRRIEWVGERGGTRIVSAFVDGRQGARVTVRGLASWPERSETEEFGNPLRRLEDEKADHPHYVVDIVTRRNDGGDVSGAI